MSDNNTRRPSLTSRLATAFRSEMSRNRLTKNHPPRTSSSSAGANVKDLSTGNPPPRVQYGAIYRPKSDDRDEQTGERRDDTDLLHGLAHRESNDSLESHSRYRGLEVEDTRPPGESMIASLPSALWERIIDYLAISEVASLAFSSKTLLQRLGPSSWSALQYTENRDEKIKFLLFIDSFLPDYLLCFECARYHLRIFKGNERLKAAIVPNPLFICPSVGKPGYKPPRIRLTPGHSLPFPFVQLVTRASNYGPRYGNAIDTLFRRYRDAESDWSHQSRYYIHKGHLLLRIVSKSFAAPGLPPSGMRHLLYSREDYTPYFSVCAHWRDGLLMDICKCALGHIPQYKQSAAQQLKKGPQINPNLRNQNPIVSLCSLCRPMRRCPECPTEYMIELKLAEDKHDPLVKFKQVIMVTRWSDLGDGSSPVSPEWAAVGGESEFDSFAAVGKRTISGIFEAQSGVTMPGQRILSLNPKNEKREEESDKWY